jgi:hypothetical protein
MRYMKCGLVALLIAGITACSGGSNGYGGSMMPPGAQPPMGQDTLPASSASSMTPGAASNAPSNAVPNAAPHAMVANAMTVNITVYGVVASTYSGGFTIKTTTTCKGGGYLHIYYNSSTAFSGPRLAAGETAHVSGNGGCGTSVTAIRVTLYGTAPPSGSGPKHVLTSDYLGGKWGTKSIAWSAAAPYLTWAETSVQDSRAIAATGIKTMLYVDPNRARAGVGDPMYTSDETTYSHNCSSTRVYDVYHTSITQYVLNPGSSSTRALFAKYVNSLKASGHVDALFADNTGALSAFAPYDPFNAMPCYYSDAGWISAEIGLYQSSPVPVVFNGLSGLNGHAPSLSIGLLAGSNTVGGTLEDCYADNSMPKMTGWLWQAMENTELQVAARNKRFDCMGEDYGTASTQISARIYDYASFLLTYNPSTSVYRPGYATPSGFHVTPETLLVPTSPVVAAPSSISGLVHYGGTYVREYRTCYLRGTSVGACAVVVNSDTVSHPFPFTQYHHTLSLSGNGVLDGGTVSTSGPAPPSTLAAKEAAIVFI